MNGTVVPLWISGVGLVVAAGAGGDGLAGGAAVTASIEVDSDGGVQRGRGNPAKHRRCLSRPQAGFWAMRRRNVGGLRERGVSSFPKRAASTERGDLAGHRPRNSSAVNSSVRSQMEATRRSSAAPRRRLGARREARAAAERIELRRRDRSRSSRSRQEAAGARRQAGRGPTRSGRAGGAAERRAGGGWRLTPRAVARGA